MEGAAAAADAGERWCLWFADAEADEEPPPSVAVAVGMRLGWCEESAIPDTSPPLPIRAAAAAAAEIAPLFAFPRWPPSTVC